MCKVWLLVALLSRFPSNGTWGFRLLRPIGFIILENFRVLLDKMHLVGSKGREGEQRNSKYIFEAKPGGSNEYLYTQSTNKKSAS